MRNTLQTKAFGVSQEFESISQDIPAKNIGNGDHDELLYRPGMIDPCTKDKFIKLERSFLIERTHSGALTSLHPCRYRFEDTLKEINADDTLLFAEANFVIVEDNNRSFPVIDCFFSKCTTCSDTQWMATDKYLSDEGIWCFSRMREAKLLAEASCSVVGDADRLDMLCRLGIIDPHTEDEYMKIARSSRMFAIMGTRMTENEKHWRMGDVVIDNALTTLHRCGNRCDDTLKEMSANGKLLFADVNFMTLWIYFI
ncbi:unnamed protein product [Angiostrongylus costaricensis]|uniref:BTB domain-containing protein n=1 Tax=Angiostrongylus costaricensis TaxID=334426 RepID=A0A158PFH7_ANGCS|nr:unnamed protein product [Angiostrongylus costaricensis]